MNIPLDNFNIILQKLNAKVNLKVSCPMNQNQLCLQAFTNCEKGLADNCHQRYKFSVGKNFYNVEVTFYGKDKKGFIESDSTSIVNFVNRTKLDLAELLK